jgi:hypothetical protein
VTSQGLQATPTVRPAIPTSPAFGSSDVEGFKNAAAKKSSSLFAKPSMQY